MIDVYLNFDEKGLVHKSQVARDRVEDINEVLNVGQDVFVKCLKVERQEDGSRPKIALSMKFADQSKWTQFYIFACLLH